MSLEEQNFSSRHFKMIYEHLQEELADLSDQELLELIDDLRLEDTLEQSIAMEFQFWSVILLVIGVVCLIDLFIFLNWDVYNYDSFLETPIFVRIIIWGAFLGLILLNSMLTKNRFVYLTLTRNDGIVPTQLIVLEAESRGIEVESYKSFISRQTRKWISRQIYPEGEEDNVL